MTSKAASLPEITGDAALLVDPLDVRGMTKAIRIIDADSDLRVDLGRQGLERAKAVFASTVATCGGALSLRTPLLKTWRAKSTEGAYGHYSSHYCVTIRERPSIRNRNGAQARRAASNNRYFDETGISLRAWYLSDRWRNWITSYFPAQN